MGEYDPEGACPKCGMTPGENSSWGPISTQYCDGGRGTCRMASGEHLHRRCSRCGYEWTESVVSGKG